MITDVTSSLRFFDSRRRPTERDVAALPPAQIDSYTGLEGWPVPGIFGRSAESIDALPASQRLKYGAQSRA